MDGPRYRRISPWAEPPIAIYIKRQSLEESPDIAQALAAALEHLELGVQPFHKAAGVRGDAVICDAVEPAVEQLEEGVKARRPLRSTR